MADTIGCASARASSMNRLVVLIACTSGYYCAGWREGLSPVRAPMLPIKAPINMRYRLARERARRLCAVGAATCEETAIGEMT